MDIECVCGTFHDLSQTATILVVLAYQNGDLLQFNKGAIEAVCMLQAFTEENLDMVKKRYPRRAVTWE